MNTYSLLDWIDISAALNSGVPHWPGNTPFEIAKDHDMAKGDHDNVSRISMGVHTGTHMDAPLHFLANGASMDTLPFRATVGRARVIEIENSETITVQELQTHDLEPHERLLFKTRNSARNWPEQEFLTDFVYIPHEAAEFLAEKNVQTVGVDYLSVGGYKKDGAQTHAALLSAGIWIIEGLNLAGVAPGHYDLVLPAAQAGGRRSRTCARHYQEGKMRAATVSISKRSTGVIDVEPPKITAPDQVLLRVLQVGVCGTDREICAFEYGDPPSGSDYLVLGHECLGEVVEVGSQVTGFKRGDLAVPMVRRPCEHPECVACRAGRPDFCYTGDFTERGIKQRHGFMTETIVDSERYMNLLPATLREVGVLTEPLTIAEKALEQIKAVQTRLPWTARHHALVLGAGPVGLLGAMTLVNAGFDVTVYSKTPEPNAAADIARAIGASYISSERTSIEAMAEQVGNIDVVYEAVGASQFAFDVLRVLGTNGLFVFTGVPGHHAPVSVDTDTIMRNIVLKNQAVVGSVNAGKIAFEEAIRDLSVFHEKWPDALKGLLTGRFPLERFNEPIEGHSGIKNVIEIG